MSQDCSKRCAGKEREVWWRWAKRLCKDESEWLSAHCEAPEITVADGRHQVGTVYGHCVWTAAGVVMGTRVVREEHVDGRRDRGNERVEMSKDRQAEFRHPGRASAERRSAVERSPQLPRTSTETGLAGLRNLFCISHFAYPIPYPTLKIT